MILSEPPAHGLGAYPLLSASDLMRHLKEGAAACTWHSGEGDVVADLRAQWDGSYSCRLRYRVREAGTEIQAGEFELSFVFVPLGKNARSLVGCPQCDRRCDIIVLTRRGWGCRVCCNIRYNNQHRHSLFDLSDDLKRVEELTSGGRPSGQWNDVYHALLQRKRRASRQLDGARPTVNPHGRPAMVPRIIAPRWHRASAWQGIDPAGFPIPEGVSGNLEEAAVEREQLRYWEAYPSMSAVDARRASRSGKSLCLWRDVRGQIIGGGEIRWRSAHQLALRFAIHRTGVLSGGSGEASFEIVYEGSAENNKRPLIICSSCGRARSAIALRNGNWRCRECHGLAYRSSLVGTQVRNAEKYARLRKEVAELRASPRAGKRLQERLVEMEQALAKAGPLPHPVANRTFLHVVSAEWSAEGYSADGFYDHLS